MLQSPLKGESAGLETSDAKGTLLDLCAGCIDQEQDVISQLSFQHRSQFYVALVSTTIDGATNVHQHKVGISEPFSF